MQIFLVFTDSRDTRKRLCQELSVADEIVADKRTKWRDFASTPAELIISDSDGINMEMT